MSMLRQPNGQNPTPCVDFELRIASYRRVVGSPFNQSTHDGRGATEPWLPSQAGCQGDDGILEASGSGLVTDQNRLQKQGERDGKSIEIGVAQEFLRFILGIAVDPADTKGRCACRRKKRAVIMYCLAHAQMKGWYGKEWRSIAAPLGAGQHCTVVLTQFVCKSQAPRSPACFPRLN